MSVVSDSWKKKMGLKFKNQESTDGNHHLLLLANSINSSLS